MLAYLDFVIFACGYTIIDRLGCCLDIIFWILFGSYQDIDLDICVYLACMCCVFDY